MTVVKGLVSDGATIVATIHSPTAYAFTLFDSLMLLIRGRVVYFGPTGPTATSYVKSLPGLESLGHKLAISKSASNQNLVDADAAERHPAEWMMDCFTRADREKRGGEFADAYDISELKKVCCHCLCAEMCCTSFSRCMRTQHTTYARMHHCSNVPCCFHYDSSCPLGCTA